MSSPEYQSLQTGPDSHSGISDLSHDAIEELLQNGPVEFRWWPRLVAWESRILWQLSGASISVSLFTYLLVFVTLIFAGHLDPIEFAGASVACVGIKGLAYGIMIGMASAVQTVSGQAYGAKQYAAMGIICQRAIFLDLIAAVLLTFVYWYYGAILKAIGQSESIAQQGQIFARSIILQLYAFAISFPMQRFLQTQNIVNPLAYMSFEVLVMHMLLSWLVVDVLEYGLAGAGFTLSFSWWVFVILNGLYIILSSRCKQSWTGFSVKVFSGIWPYVKLTIASAVMMCLETWFVQGLVLISGLLPDAVTSLDSSSICVSYWNLDINFMLGLCVCTSIRVSNELGAGHPRLATFSVLVVHGTSVLISIIFCAIILVFRVGLGKLFDGDPEVIEIFKSLTALLAISVFLNGIQLILSGVAIGSGWQDLAAYVNLASYYLVGLPIGCLLGFKTSLGVAGIWWGVIIGVLLQTVTLILLTARTDWDLEVMKATARVIKSMHGEKLELLGEA